MKRVFSLPLLALTIGLYANISAAQDAEMGAELYATNCAACHGDGAKGDGDMASVMTIPSPNLTLLAKNAGGEFPMSKIIQIIDGRTGVRSHGGAMPIFGAIFKPDKGPGMEYGGEVAARGRALALALFLETIQQK